MERWQQIESVFQAALQRDPAEREAYVREACREDADLRHEVSSLLANHSESADSKPWAAAAAAQLIAEPALLKAGQRLGPYEVLELVGAGGMGEVYKARDTRLKRDVAIKICAAQFSERFEREARAIASLNHPNICQLYDVGPNFLVMELVDGENLAVPLPVETVLNYARQIAEALEAAHEKGIVHRDLKPANLKVNPDGVVKVLDFGLAKAFDGAQVTDTSNSPTQTLSATRAGVILGTAPYMSPEQARGAVVDKRGDIWAFGCVLYEMLTGEQAFQGETTSDILAAVLKEEPDWSRIPLKVQPLLRRCLEKDPKRRLRDIGDAMPLLDGGPEVTPARRPWPWIVAAVLAIAAAVGWWPANRSEPLQPHPLVQLSAELSPDTTVDRFRGGDQLAVSPDGTRICAAVRDLANGKYHLVTRRLDQNEFAPLSGTDGANTPFFSPDGQWIGFFADGKLKKISVQGGSPVTICGATSPRGGSWGDDDHIIAALNDAEGILWRISSSGGVATPATALDKKNGETAQRYPQVLPGSQKVLFTSFASRARSDDADIDVLSIRTGERKVLHRGGVFGRYLATSNGTGHLVYMHEDTLFTTPFDLSSLAVTGAPRLVLEDVSKAGVGPSWNFDLSQTGTLVYASWKGVFSWSMFWLNSAGKAQPLHSSPGGYYLTPSFSPDGRYLAFGMNTGPLRADIWVTDLDRDTTSRLTSLPADNNFPVWTSDGKNIVFEALGSAAPGMYWIRADGSAEPQRLTDGRPRQIPCSFSPNGKRLAYNQLTDAGNSEIWTAPIEGDSDHPRLGTAELLLRAPYSALSPAISPDGRWLAYASNETGTFEVYVRPFPEPGGRQQISTGGGRNPIWSPIGRELFFLASDRRIMVAGYSARGDSFTAGKPRVWSAVHLAQAPFRSYDLAPDGKRFVGLLYPDGTSEPKPFTHVTVLLNFFDDVQRRVPAGAK